MKPACSGDLINVLFVDDDADDRMLFQTAVGEIAPACRLTMAWNGTDALRVLASEGTSAPHVIFLDINMPQMNGRELLGRLKELPEFQAIPVIVYSTSTAQEDKQHMNQLGAHAYLVKPVTYRQLCTDLWTVLTGLGFTLPELAGKG